MNLIKICTGTGGQGLGLEQVEFDHSVFVEHEIEYGDCLRGNRPQWKAICGDVHNFDGKLYHNKIDLQLVLSV